MRVSGVTVMHFLSLPRGGEGGFFWICHKGTPSCGGKLPQALRKQIKDRRAILQMLILYPVMQRESGREKRCGVQNDIFLGLIRLQSDSLLLVVVAVNKVF